MPCLLTYMLTSLFLVAPGLLANTEDGWAHQWKGDQRFSLSISKCKDKTCRFFLRGKSCRLDGELRVENSASATAVSLNSIEKEWGCTIKLMRDRSLLKTKFEGPNCSQTCKPHPEWPTSFTVASERPYLADYAWCTDDQSPAMQEFCTSEDLQKLDKEQKALRQKIYFEENILTLNWLSMAIMSCNDDSSIHECLRKRLQDNVEQLKLDSKNSGRRTYTDLVGCPPIPLKAGGQIRFRTDGQSIGECSATREWVEVENFPNKNVEMKINTAIRKELTVGKKLKQRECPGNYQNHAILDSIRTTALGVSTYVNLGDGLGNCWAFSLMTGKRYNLLSFLKNEAKKMIGRQICAKLADENPAFAGAQCSGGGTEPVIGDSSQYNEWSACLNNSGIEISLRYHKRGSVSVLITNAEIPKNFTLPSDIKLD